MAAYAALVSLMYLIEQITHHPRPPVSLDRFLFESLSKIVTFFQEFLEGHSAGYNKEVDALEMRIADAAYAAEDVIESHIVDRILARSTTDREDVRSEEEMTNLYFYQDIQRVIDYMESIRKEAMEMNDGDSEHVEEVQSLKMKTDSASASSLRSSALQNTMVGFDDILVEVMDKLTDGQSGRPIIPIVGMGGMGKTTLARNVYQNDVVVHRFDFCAWVNISQEYKIREVILELLQESERTMEKLNQCELGEKLCKMLSGRRYLIVLDDVWDTEVWEKLQFCFPDYNNGSRILITTRLSSLASYVTDSGVIEVPFLDEEYSWSLFSETVFGEEGCPVELEAIGKKIVKNCKGLPLSIVVIGGLIAKSKHTREHWEHIAENLNSLVNLEDDERCLRILRMSYNHLPVYLKPCFLYMGVFPEDSVIRVSMLVELWVAEGFLKPISGTSMEVAAREYLKELISRNLILVHKFGCTGNLKACRVHDLIRDLCIRESQKQSFYSITKPHDLKAPVGMYNQRRLVILKRTSGLKVVDALQPTSLARSLICCCDRSISLTKFGLLRILKTLDGYSSRYFAENMSWLVNSRYLDVSAVWEPKFPSSFYLLWNIQTLIFGDRYSKSLIAPVEFWNMTQLRHVKHGALYLPDPPRPCVAGGQSDIVLKNLQTLQTIRNFKCGEEVVKRILNIKKLKVSYCDEPEEGLHSYCLDNLGHLHQLESFCCYLSPKLKPNGTHFVQRLSFPRSIKKLAIQYRYVHWEDMLEKIGSLPLLEKLKLIDGYFRGRKWETVEGQFRSLKYLNVFGCLDLEYWITESSHFPRLEHLVLEGLKTLKEIPSEIGEIPTLQLIELIACGKSVVSSAEKILEELEELHGEVTLQIRSIY